MKFLLKGDYDQLTTVTAAMIDAGVLPSGSSVTRSDVYGFSDYQHEQPKPRKRVQYMSDEQFIAWATKNVDRYEKGFPRSGEPTVSSLDPKRPIPQHDWRPDTDQQQFDFAPRTAPDDKYWQACREFGRTDLTPVPDSEDEDARILTRETLAQLKAKWREIARATHPGHGGDAATFARMEQLYRLLCQPFEYAASVS